MSSDNIFEQVEALIASDERQQIPETVDQILKLLAKLPGTGALISIVRYESEKQKIENTELMLRVAWEELKRLSVCFEDFLKDAVKRGEARRLILDATRKAEDLRDAERVKRIGMILAHALAVGRASNFDTAEEMMRVARDLSDQDVVVLRELCAHQLSALEQRRWALDVDQVNVIWRENPPKLPGSVRPGEVDSILLKLQGLGLTAAVERRETQVGPNTRVFALLPKGADFVRFIQASSG